MEKRSYLFILGLAAVVAVGISLPLQQRNVTSGLGQNTQYLVAETDGYDDAYGEPAPSDDSSTGTTDSGTTDTGTTNDDYSSEDF